ncbi:MAG TPA: MoxR family ATPase [Thermoanaerobaculia bacterium]
MASETLSYRGDGSVIEGPPPMFERIDSLDDPRHYIAEPGLRDAVNVAITLGIPLLVTGEPGTGKTQLAWSVAHELGLGEPLVFSAKTTSLAQDLFYRYDALGHFRQSRFGGEDVPVMKFVDFEALGIATLLMMNPADASPYLPRRYQNLGPRRAVVLIDEIDKAPRDLPNDILREIETMTFRVKEAGLEFPPDGQADPRYRPIVIITSNSEKNLPDAFLRRCAFFHISFPDKARLVEIVNRKFGKTRWFTPQRVTEAVEKFTLVRNLNLRKPPATAEFLAWMRILRERDVDPRDITRGAREAIAVTAAILSKNREDAEQIAGAF